MKERPLTRLALYAGGGLGGLALTGLAGLAGVMRFEARLAERRIPTAQDDPPPSNDTTWAAAGVSRTRPPIRLALIGDSTAAGYGVYRDRDTPGVRLAIGISEVARRPVHLTNVAVVGAESPDLGVQIDAIARRRRPELAVIMIGANDVTEGTKPSVAVPYLEDAVRRLRAMGAQVIVCTCPDLGTIRPLAQPLRAYARHLSRKMAREQTIAVVSAGGRTVYQRRAGATGAPSPSAPPSHTVLSPVAAVLGAGWLAPAKPSSNASAPASAPAASPS